MTSILRIVRWSTEWSTVILGCGHRLRVRRAQMAREQLYVGKAIECEECEECEETK